MNRTNNEAARQVRSLPIEEWRRIGQEGGAIPVRIVLEGDSMRPLIRRGIDPVTILPLARELMIGDIVLFHGGPGRFVVHRVYRMKDGLVQTLGDNCWNPDPWMKTDRVWGLVVKMERGGRTYPLDSEASRRWGKIWMAIHPVRLVYRKARGFAARCVRRVFPKRKKGGGANG